jgi:hypothetical protein
MATLHLLNANRLRLSLLILAIKILPECMAQTLGSITFHLAALLRLFMARTHNGIFQALLTPRNLYMALKMVHLAAVDLQARHLQTRRSLALKVGVPAICLLLLVLFKVRANQCSKVILPRANQCFRAILLQERYLEVDSFSL